MPDLFSKISDILSNPESAQKIREIASNLSTAPDNSAPADEAAEAISSAPPAMPVSSAFDSMDLISGLSGSGTHSRELALLNAVRPYLRASRAGKIDSAIKAIRVIDLLSALR